MTSVSTSPFHISMPRKYNAWYSVKDGNWDDPTVWISNGTKKHSLPQAGDDVYVNHVVKWNWAQESNPYSNTIKNLYINGSLTCNPGLNQTRFFVNGNVYCSGTLDLSGSTGGGGFTLSIGGDNSFFNNFVQGNSTSNITINYTSSNSFILPDIPYYNLAIGSSVPSTKWVKSNLSLAGYLYMTSNVTLELGNYDLSVYNYAGDGVQIPTLSKTGSGIINFTGPNHSISGNISFTGNPTINLSGSFNGASRANGAFNFGTGTLNVLQNSTWTFSSGGNIPISLGAGLSVLIASGKTLTYTGVAPWINNGTINGVDETSTLNISSGFGYGNTNPIMTTGIFNYNFSGTSVIYTRSTMILPFSTFYDLVIDSGTTTLGANTTVARNLTVSATFQLSNYDLTVGGTTSFSGPILKSGAGTVSFHILNCTFFTGRIDFSVGNPTVNLSGNFTGTATGGFDFGSSPINIVQSLSIGLAGSSNVEWISFNSILIASGKTLTNIGLSTTSGGISTTGTIDGVDSTSIFNNQSIFSYYNSVAPMANGTLYTNQATNTFKYSKSGDQDVKSPGDSSTPGYKNLILNGTGEKKLLGNVSVKGIYILAGSATLNKNGFDLSNP